MPVSPKRFAGGLVSVLAVGLVLGGPAPAGGGGSPTLPEGMRQEAIHDPALNMDAYFVVLPTDWHLKGAVFQGTGCSEIPFPVFRASSPDGLTQLERFPRLDWKWGNGPYAPKRPPPGCLPLDSEMHASEFLRHVSAMLGVEYVAEVPIAPEKLAAQQRAIEQTNAMSEQFAARNHTLPMVQRADLAEAKVRYRNGSFPMEGLIRAVVECLQTSSRGARQQTFSSETCSATIRMVRAPEGKLDSAIKKLDPAGAFMNPQWDQAWRQAFTQRIQMEAQQQQANFNQQMQAQNQQFQQSQAQQLQQHQQFLQSQAVQQHTHDQFISTLQRGTDMSMQRAAQSSAAGQTAASDVVDYALGQQTVRDPSTGVVNKVYGGYNQTWVDDTGKNSFQTSDPNANPNGYLKGNWTLQQQVHGDGTSK